MHLTGRGFYLNFFKGIIFGALTGSSGKSPGALTGKNVFRINFKYMAGWFVVEVRRPRQDFPGGSFWAFYISFYGDGGGSRTVNKSHCSNFRSSAPQPPRNVNGQPSSPICPF